MHMKMMKVKLQVSLLSQQIIKRFPLSIFVVLSSTTAATFSSNYASAASTSYTLFVILIVINLCTIIYTAAFIIFNT